jgi:pimeloyl-ACP methyl ester carboxylesterase
MTDKPTLILLPGQLCDGALWAAQVDGLADIAEIVVADLTLDPSIAAMAERVLAAAPPRFALAGLSLGGYVAFEIMRAAPQRVTRLALMNTSARPDTGDQAARRRTNLNSLDVGAFKGVTPRLLPSILHPDHVKDTAMAAVVLAMTERVGRVAFELQQAAMLGRADSRPTLATIDCPTLVIGGRADRITPLALQEEIAAGISGAHLEKLEICGHLAAIEQPDTVTALMRTWLA